VNAYRAALKHTRNLTANAEALAKKADQMPMDRMQDTNEYLTRAKEHQSIADKQKAVLATETDPTIRRALENSQRSHQQTAELYTIAHSHRRNDYARAAHRNAGGEFRDKAEEHRIRAEQHAKRAQQLKEQDPVNAKRHALAAEHHQEAAGEYTRLFQWHGAEPAQNMAWQQAADEARQRANTTSHDAPSIWGPQQ
jgi:hypothetical protein